MWRPLLLYCAALTAATDIEFQPGPGLTKNADGTYSRELTEEYLAHAGVPNATAAPRAPKRSFSINDIGKDDVNVTKSEWQLRAERVLPAVLAVRWWLYKWVSVVCTMLWVILRKYKPGRPRVVRQRRTYVARRYGLPLVCLAGYIGRHILLDFSVTLEEEYLKRWNYEHGEVIKTLEADRPWTFNFSKYECRNASNATIADQVFANKRLHKAVEEMHKQLGWANAEVASQAVERQRLEAQFEAERAALSATLKRLAAVEDDVSGLAKALGFDDDDDDDAGLAKSIVRRAKTAALHASVAEDLDLLNETEVQTLMTKRKSLETNYNNSLKAFKPEAERREKEKQTSMKVHVDRNPAIDRHRHLNWTAVAHVLLQHSKYEFKRRGWEQWTKDLYSNAPRFIPLKVYRRYTLLKGTLVWMRRGEVGRAVEIRLLNATIRLNDTLKGRYNCSLSDVTRRWDPVGAQLHQTSDEARTMAERWFSAWASVVRALYERLRGFAAPRWKVYCRTLRRWDAAPPLVRARPGFAIAALLSSPLLGPPLLRCAFAWPLSAVRAYLGDLAWLLGLLGCGALGGRLRRAAGAADGAARRFAVAAAAFGWRCLGEAQASPNVHRRREAAL